ncbi:MAG: HAMP domain-containing histidine kinase [Lachnospiraceae bacterium]|nr:HAMP domain-containing histidine kinase [Lachnospiraceae bacterium]
MTESKSCEAAADVRSTAGFWHLSHEGMQRLVNDMFTLASLDNGKIAIHKTEVCLYTLFLEAYEKFEAAAIHKDIFLEISIPLESAHAPYGAPASSVTPFKIAARWASPKESAATAYCDPERLTQVFTILFDNAVSYTPEGGHILAAILESHNKFIITVSDNGPGIPDEAKEKVFSRFYRYDQSRTDKNHFGLGLSIAKEIIELHEGTITVQDSAEGGAKFIVVLPANTN